MVVLYHVISCSQYRHDAAVTRAHGNQRRSVWFYNSAGSFPRLYLLRRNSYNCSCTSQSPAILCPMLLLFGDRSTLDLTLIFLWQGRLCEHKLGLERGPQFNRAGISLPADASRQSPPFFRGTSDGCMHACLLEDRFPICIHIGVYRIQCGHLFFLMGFFLKPIGFLMWFTPALRNTVDLGIRLCPVL